MHILEFKKSLINSIYSKIWKIHIRNGEDINFIRLINAVEKKTHFTWYEKHEILKT